MADSKQWMKDAAKECRAQIEEEFDSYFGDKSRISIDTLLTEIIAKHAPVEAIAHAPEPEFIGGRCPTCGINMNEYCDLKAAASKGDSDGQ